MSRLYDRLLAHGSTMPGTKEPADLAPFRDVPVIDASEVCAYYFEGTDQEEWDLHTDFPNLAPPFESYWLEMKAPSRIVSEVYGTRPWDRGAPSAWALYVHSGDARQAASYEPEYATDAIKEMKESLERHYLESLKVVLTDAEQRGLQGEEIWTAAYERFPAEIVKNVKALCECYRTEQWLEEDPNGLRAAIQDNDEFRWAVQYTLFMEFERGRIIGPFFTWKLLIDEEGRAIPDETGQISCYVPDLSAEQVHELNSHLSKFLHPAELATCFMHCNNVERIEVTPPDKASRKHHKRYGHPLTRYYTLEIDPMKRVLGSQGGAHKNGLKRALHICRGHFKTYTEDKPLFGKRTGTYWWPQTVRGSKKHGEIVKDYSVKAPQDSGDSGA